MSDNISPEVAAIVYPGFHPDPHFSAWYGPGWTEWELVKKRTPLYEGHHQPKVPEWGYFDESDPAWGAKQIDLAADHGVTAFMFDWYWYSGVQLFHNALEKGFLQAPNNKRLKFFLMWANHEWWDFPALNNVPGMGQKTWLWVHHTLDELAAATRFCCENYFSEPNYLKIDGKPVFCWYQPNYLKEQMEAESPGTGPLDHMNAEAQKCGFDGIYFIANIGCLGGNPYSVRWDMIPRLKSDGFQAIFPYNICSTPSRPNLPPERPVHDYAEIMEAHEHVWGQCEGKGLPFNPNVSMGLDCSPRWHESVTLPVDVDNYLPFVDNCTPERYGTLCGKALDHINQHDGDSKILFLNAWNEWTEGMYLLPEKRYGTGYLEALKQAVDERAK
jgi:hypothetical protein